MFFSMKMFTARLEVIFFSLMLTAQSYLAKELVKEYLEVSFQLVAFL